MRRGASHFKHKKPYPKLLSSLFVWGATKKLNKNGKVRHVGVKASLRSVGSLFARCLTANKHQLVPSDYYLLLEIPVLRPLAVGQGLFSLKKQRNAEYNII